MARFNFSLIAAFALVLVLISAQSASALPARRFTTRTLKPVLVKKSTVAPKVIDSVLLSLKKRWSSKAVPAYKPVQAKKTKRSVVVAARKLSRNQAVKADTIWTPASLKPVNPKMKRQNVEASIESAVSTETSSAAEFPTLTMTHTNIETRTMVPQTRFVKLRVPTEGTAAERFITRTQVNYVDLASSAAPSMSGSSIAIESSLPVESSIELDSAALVASESVASVSRNAPVPIATQDTPFEKRAARNAPLPSAATV